MTTLPLKGIRILDLSRLLPGPYLTQLMVDLGAEVIKIETPRLGDYARQAPVQMGLGGLFEAVNRGKKSLALNYRNPRGRELLLKLATTADVILEGFKPGSMKRWGIDYESIYALKPDIIYCSLSGYGQSGPYSDRSGHDLNYTAVGGALALNAREGEAPIPYGVPVADLSGGMLAAIAILAALVGRKETRKGLYLDMALLDGVISWMTPLAGGAFFSGIDVKAGSLPLLGGLPCFNVYSTADGKTLSLAALEPTFWADFCETIERPDLLGRQFDRTLGPELASIFQQKTRAEWLKIFVNSEACVEAVNSFDEMLSHPQVKARGLVHEENGHPTSLNSPFVFVPRVQARSPILGEHTREILQEIGMKEAEIQILNNQGIVLVA